MLNFSYGTSLVWLASQRLNFLVELYGTSNQAFQNDGTLLDRSDSLFVNPALRAAVDLGDLQVVPGVGVPIGIGPSSGTYGVFAYLSFEHPY